MTTAPGTGLDDDAVARLSHELRTPLTSIIGYVELLTGASAGPLTRLQQDVLERIDGNAARLLRTVEELLLGYHPDRPEVVGATVVELGALVGRSLQSRGRVVAEKRLAVAFEVDGPVPVLGAPEELALLVDHLVGNAVKFTAPGGRLAVTLRADGARGSLTVSDSGCGIPADELELVFDRFYRSTTTRTARLPGAGVGLATARAVAREHGGDITVRSAVGEGSTFTLVLPLALSSAILPTTG